MVQELGDTWLAFSLWIGHLATDFRGLRMKFLQVNMRERWNLDTEVTMYVVCTIDSHKTMQIPSRTKNENWSKRVIG